MKIAHRNLFNKKSNLLFIVVGVMVLFLLVNKSNIDIVKATTNYVGGWGWGGTESTDGAYKGIGWLSFSNTADGSIIDYGVTVPAIPSTGTLPITGNAWSELYGWLSFNSADVTDCPSATGANIDSTGNLKGWARFLSIKTDAASGNSGGWNGCVSLSSTNMGDSIAYGATTTGTGIFGGYAWSPELGWIDFSRVGLNKMVNISPSNKTIKQGQSITFISTANFADGSMVGHNINWKKSGGCWNWEGCFVSDGSTITNSTSTFTNTTTHTLSNTVFTPTAIGTYNVYASATSSSPSETLWIDSPVTIVNVVFPGCSFFGDLVDTGTVVTTYSSSNSANCSAISQTNTCQSTGLFNNPPLLAYKVCSSSSGVATPLSVSVSSATIHANDSVAITWDINNPDNTCYIEASSTDPLSFTDTANLNKIFKTFTTPANTDINDPYSTSTPRTVKNAIQAKYNSAISSHAKGQKTVILNYPTSFTAHCGVTSTTDKKIRVNVTKNLEG